MIIYKNGECNNYITYKDKNNYDFHSILKPEKEEIIDNDNCFFWNKDKIIKKNNKNILDLELNNIYQYKKNNIFNYKINPEKNFLLFNNYNNNKIYFFNTKTPNTKIFQKYEQSYYNYKFQFINNITENLNYNIQYDKLSFFNEKNFFFKKSFYITSNYKKNFYNIWFSFIRNTFINKNNNLYFSFFRLKNKNFNLFQSYEKKNNIFIYNLNHKNKKLFINKEFFPYYNTNIYTINNNIFYQKKINYNMNIILGIKFYNMYYNLVQQNKLNKYFYKNIFSIINKFNYSPNNQILYNINYNMTFIKNNNNITSIQVSVEHPIINNFILKYNLLLNKMPKYFSYMSPLYNKIDYIYFLNKKMNINLFNKNLGIYFSIHNIHSYNNINENIIKYYNNILLYNLHMRYFFLYKKMKVLNQININFLNFEDLTYKINNNFNLYFLYKKNFYNKNIILDIGFLINYFPLFKKINSNYYYIIYNKFSVFFIKKNIIKNQNLLLDIIINIKFFRIKTYLKIKNFGLLINNIFNIKNNYNKVLFNVGFIWDLFT